MALEKGVSVDRGKSPHLRVLVIPLLLVLKCTSRVFSPQSQNSEVRPEKTMTGGGDS